jgi:tetrahydromethanopterin S-methyltransferase subunit F
MKFREDRVMHDRKVGAKDIPATITRCLQMNRKDSIHDDERLKDNEVVRVVLTFGKQAARFCGLLISLFLQVLLYIPLLAFLAAGHQEDAGCDHPWDDD